MGNGEGLLRIKNVVKKIDNLIGIRERLTVHKVNSKAVTLEKSKFVMYTSPYTAGEAERMN